MSSRAPTSLSLPTGQILPLWTYPQLELLNREDNFNKKFSRKPAVGVLKVAGGPERRGPRAVIGGAGRGGLPPLPKDAVGHRSGVRKSAAVRTGSRGRRGASVERKRSSSSPRPRPPLPGKRN